MPESSLHDLLMQSFPKSNKQDWSVASAREIKGKKQLEALQWKTNDGITYLPYYDAADTSDLAYLSDFQIPPPQATYPAWQHIVEITVADIRQSNHLALSHLENGSAGILFDVRGLQDVDVEGILAGIEWPYCVISFVSGQNEKIIPALGEHIQRKGYNTLLSGSIFWENSSGNPVAPPVTQIFGAGFYNEGIYVPTDSAVSEIANALTRAAKHIDARTDLGHSPNMVIQNISLSVSVGTDFFLAIAKFKALRILWFQLARAFGDNLYQPKDLFIHARSEPWTDPAFQPHANMINSTTAGIAAVLGGCNSLQVSPETEGNEIMRRIANNVSTILTEESHLAKVTDAVAGAYAVDSLVDQLAQQAWKHFQHQIQSA